MTWKGRRLEKAWLIYIPVVLEDLVFNCGDDYEKLRSGALP